jgi:hypothetical protein
MKKQDKIFVVFIEKHLPVGCELAELIDEDNKKSFGVVALGEIVHKSPNLSTVQDFVLKTWVTH